MSSQIIKPGTLLKRQSGCIYLVLGKVTEKHWRHVRIVATKSPGFLVTGDVSIVSVGDIDGIVYTVFKGKR